MPTSKNKSAYLTVQLVDTIPGLEKGISLRVNLFNDGSKLLEIMMKQSNGNLAITERIALSAKNAVRLAKHLVKP